MTEPDLDPRAALAGLAAQGRAHAELDRLFGVSFSPVPALPPLRPAPVVRPQAEPAPRGRPGAQPSPAAGPSLRPPPTGGPSLRPPPSGGPSLRPLPSAAAPAGAEPAAAPAGAEPSEELAARRRRNEQALHALADRMAGCTRCPLHEGRTRLVFGQGDAAAELVFVGEGPGYHEDQQGLAFVGASGELLTKMIEAMGLTRDEVFICNVVKCRPPKNRNPRPDEMGTCLPYLREQLDVIRPRVICALGRTAAVGLGVIGPDGRLGPNRGRFHDWNGIPTMLTYHPAYLLRQPGEKRKAWHDLQALFPHLTRRRTS